MSIINEALKKAQREPARTVTAPVVNEVRLKTEFKEELLGKKSRFNWGPFFVLGVLMLIVGPILAPIFTNPFLPSPSSSPALTAAGGASAEPTLISVGSVVPQNETSSSLRNPAVNAQFAIEEIPTPPAMIHAAFSKSELNLSGIVFSEKESYCLVNGKVLKVGEAISGATIVKITPDQVTFNSDGQLIVLSTTA